MAKFCPIVWPEDPTPMDVVECKECGLYEHGTRMVWGEGSKSAPIMIILDNPGSREDRGGNSIVCGTRQTLQAVANEVNLTADDLYVTYILKRRPIKKYDKDNVRKICKQHLLQQIDSQKPKLIFCLGDVAVQSFFNNKDCSVKSLRGKFYDVNGYKTTVAYHPLAVRRRPNLWPLFLDDWQLVESEIGKL